LKLAEQESSLARGVHEPCIPRRKPGDAWPCSVKVFLITADGDIVENPRHYRQAERYLVKCQRRVSKRKKGSHRRRKAVALLAKAHQHVRRQRADFHHKTALTLIRQYDVIYVEVIQPANLSRRPAPKAR
jgi:putative transposase